MQELIVKATTAANDAVKDYTAKYGEPAYCGFAWVEVIVDRANSKEAKMLLAAGFKKSYKPKRLEYWSPSDYRGQSMDVKEAAASAFAAVLKTAGIRAIPCSRAD